MNTNLQLPFLVAFLPMTVEHDDTYRYDHWVLYLGTEALTAQLSCQRQREELKGIHLLISCKNSLELFFKQIIPTNAQVFERTLSHIFHDPNMFPSSSDHPHRVISNKTATKMYTCHFLLIQTHMIL